jgi:GNAT superfamily N-acetyltransferase
MPARIRPMHAGDKPSLMQILANTPEFKSYEVTVAEEVIDSYLADPVNSGYHILVAVDGGRLAGYLCYGPTPCTDGTWDIYWEAVAPEKRGQGIGTALMKAAEAAITKSGAWLSDRCPRRRFLCPRRRPAHPPKTVEVADAASLYLK